jgi:menaquinone-dependent protoporphyrinogen oxidase
MSCQDQSAYYGSQTRPNQILVAYASALGSTQEVAVEIGKMLAGENTSVAVRPVQEIHQIQGVQAILLGSAVQHGNWLPEAIEFIEKQHALLNQVPVALFTVHISNQGDDDTSRRHRQAYLDSIRPMLPNPIDSVFFAGKFDRRGAALLMPGWIARFIPTMDFRKWGKIRSWAAAVQPKLLPSG